MPIIAIALDIGGLIGGAFILGAAIWAAALFGTPLAAAPVLGALFLVPSIVAHVLRRRRGQRGCWGLIAGSLGMTAVFAVAVEPDLQWWLTDTLPRAILAVTG